MRIDRRLALIIKDGQTNTSAVVYDLDTFKLVKTLCKGTNNEFTTDGTSFTNLHGIVTEALHALQSESPDILNSIVAIGGTGRGAIFDVVDENEMPVRKHGVQTNIDPLSPQAYTALDELMTEGQRWEKYLLPGIFGGLEPARTVVDWILRNPELLKTGKRIRALDQLMIGPLVKPYQGIDNEPGGSAAYFGCHTGLKGMGNPEGVLGFSDLAHRIHDLMLEKTGVTLIGGLIPNRLYTPRDFLDFTLHPDIARRYGLRNNVVVMPFDHDTTGEEALIQVLAAQDPRIGNQRFISTILGSWMMDRFVPGENTSFSVAPSLFGRGILGQTDFYGNPTPAVLTASGEEFHLLWEQQLNIKGLKITDTDEGTVSEAVNQLLQAQDVFIMHGRGGRVKFASQFPHSKYYGNPDMLIVGNSLRVYESANNAYAAAMLMTVAPKFMVYNSIGVLPNDSYVLSGGPADKVTALLFSSMLSSPVYRITDCDGKIVSDVGDLSTLARIRAHMEGQLPHEVNVSALGFNLVETPKPFVQSDVRQYCERWCELQAQTK